MKPKPHMIENVKNQTNRRAKITEKGK